MRFTWKCVICRGLRAYIRFFALFSRNERIQNNRILFLSRQSNIAPMDFQLLQKCLLIKDSALKFITISSRIEPGIVSKIKFLYSLRISIRELARCKVCVLDAYWPAVSLLDHRPEQTVIQLWHAAGKIKQSGYRTLGKPDGRDQKIAEILRMHRNYDLVISGNPKWNPYYCDSFHVSEDVLRNLGLPRMDALLKYEEPIRHQIFKAHPDLQGKPLILYAPTFRRTQSDDWKRLIDVMDTDRYNIVIKSHPNQILEDAPGTIHLDDFTTRQLLTAADYVITDYSSIALEAAALRKKTYYYLYDHESYCRTNGVNVDLEKEMPGCVFYDAESLNQAIESGKYEMDVLDAYRKRNLPENLGHCTEDIADLILQCCRK